MLGSLAIIRFRPNLKDSRDIIFMFDSLAAGISCGVSGFGIAIVGSVGDKDKDKVVWVGSAYIFRRKGAVWEEQAKISASGVSQWFGTSVHISGDYAIGGSTGDDDKGKNSGSIYTFVRSGTSWEEVSKHTPNDGAAEDYFGFSISTSGNYATVGAWRADAKGLDSGAVYIYNLRDLSLPGKAVEPQGKLPTRWGRVKRAELYQNYPNPFNPETWLPFQLVKPANVTIRIYNQLGKSTRTLKLDHKKEGIYLDKARAAYWDGKNDAGESVASGIYFYRLEAGDFSQTRKMTVLK